MEPIARDVHSHVHFEMYRTDRNEVLNRALLGGVWSIQVGTQKDTSINAVALAEEYNEGVYATIGLHPIHTQKSFHDKAELKEEYSGEEFDKKFYKRLAESKKVVAIGECGLDYFRLGPESKKKQKENFVKQIEFSHELQLPLMLHIRDAYKDALDIITAHKGVCGNVHYFAGDWNVAKRFLELDFTLSFTGVITFTRDYDEVIKRTPLENLLSETDAPYVAPVPYRGKRNEPLYVLEVVKKIAEIKGLNQMDTGKNLLKNARRLFQV